jgi:glutamate-1-semialdehyde aminotransferase
MNELEEVFFSFTFGGEALSLAAALATIKEMRQKDVIQHLWKQGGKLKDGYNRLAREHGVTEYTQCFGLPAHAAIYFKIDGNDSLELKSLFQQEMIKRGILTMGVHNLCFCHSDEDIERTLESYADVLAVLRQAIDENNIEKYLEGEKVKPVFRSLV